MIQTLNYLRNLVSNKIKVIPNNQPEKTQAADVKQILTDILDTTEDLVNKLGLLLNQNISDTNATTISQIAATYQKISDAFNGSYTNLTNKPDLTVFRKTSDAINYNSLTNLPTLFNGTWASLTGKPTLVTAYNQLTGLPTLFSGSYLDLTNKPSIFDGNYNNLTNKPIIITDYTQLTNKPKIATLLWNQLNGVMVTNTTTETNALLSANGSGSLAIAANPITATAFRLTGRGLFSIQGVTSPSLTIKVYLGSTVIAQGTSSSLLIGASNKSFSFGVDIMVAATNTIYAQGFFAYYATALSDTLSSTPLINPSGGTSNTTVDLTVANDVKMTFTWNSASTQNQIIVKLVNLEKLNN